MLLIDSSYFIGPLNIAQTDTIGVRENLNLYMNRYQKRFLTLLLGATVYDSFMIGLNQDPVPQKWIDLKNKLVDVDTKQSPIANYVYYWYMYFAATQTVGIGEVKTKSENSDPVSNAKKMRIAWNEMCDFVIDTRPWFNDYYAMNMLDPSLYFYNLYCYNTYKDEFAKQTINNL